MQSSQQAILRWQTSTVFIGAFLLFMVQPMEAKMLLPRFGGSSSVWAVCLFFFQTLLLLGYAYAHALSGLKAVAQKRIHGGVLLIALTSAWLLPEIKLTTPQSPSLSILLSLFQQIGFPFILLSSTSVLIQTWRNHVVSSSDKVYSLYASSNLGSLLGLFFYPLLIEPFLTLPTQTLVWKALLVGYVASYGLSMHLSLKANPSTQLAKTAKHKSSAPLKPKLWKMLAVFGLAGCGSVALSSFTQYLTADVAPFPLLWIIPLALYLFTFVIVFADTQNDTRVKHAPLMALLLGVLSQSSEVTSGMHILVVGTILCMTLFMFLLVIHGLMVRLKPHSDYLTQFYLWMCAGSATGSGFVALVAPTFFKNTFEYPAVVVVMTLVSVGFLTLRAVELFSESSKWLRRTYIILGCGCAVVIIVNVCMEWVPKLSEPNVVRNFYGVKRIVNFKEYRALTHGRITHGGEAHPPLPATELTTYYGRASGLGLSIQALRDAKGNAPLRIGAIGMGVGTVASFLEEGDSIRFYEIDPQVVQMAKEHFRFLSEAKGSVEIVLGDARVNLEAESPQGFDVLLIDAFSGDSIPTHLLTQEAMNVYARHVRTHGVMAYHVSNRYMELNKVVASVAQNVGLNHLHVHHHTDPFKEPHLNSSIYVLVAYMEFPLSMFNRSDVSVNFLTMDESLVWTDNFSSPVRVFTLPTWDDFVEGWKDFKKRVKKIGAP